MWSWTWCRYFSGVWLFVGLCLGIIDVGNLIAISDFVVLLQEWSLEIICCNSDFYFLC